MTLVVGAGTIVGFAPSASADVIDITCAGSQTVTYSPGLTPMPTNQFVSVTTTYSSCASLAQPGITSGQSFVSTNVPGRTCFSPLDTDTITVTITWNTGQTSTFTATCLLIPLTSRTGVTAADITSI